MASILWLLTALSFFGPASAQLDPRSQVLVRPTGPAPQKDELNSDRYQIRDSRPRDSRDIPKVIRPPTALETPAPTPQESAPAIRPSDSQPVVSPAPPATSPVNSEVEAVAPEFDLIRISLAPAFLYADARSNFSLREYFTSSPGYLAAASVWVSPYLGIQTELFSSLKADTRAVSGGQDRIAVEHQWFSAGLRWRQNFGSSWRAPSMVIGLDYSEYKFKAPGDAVQRQSLQTSGAAVSLEVGLPQSRSFAYELGFSFLPRGHQRERATGIDFSSGTKSESTALKFLLGGRHELNSRHEIFWRLEHRLDRDVYSGAASQVDPATGQVPSGVSVNQSTSSFTLGITWSAGR